MLWDDFFNFIKVGGLADEGVHLARVDLCGWGVIDKGDGCAVVVGNSLAGGGLHVFADFCATVGITEHVHVSVVEAGEDNGFGIHHGGDEAEQFRLEAGVIDFKVGFQRLAAESALCGVFQFAHVAGAVDFRWF